MDIVICTALKDCLFLRKNLFFIKKNLKPENIYILTKRRNFRLLPQCDDIITLVDEDKLIDDLNFKEIKRVVDKHLSNHLYGWYFQQFLKLGFALSKYAKDDYLVWDADTVPLVSLIFKDEQGNTLVLPKKEHHNPYFDTITNLFDVKEFAPYSFISEHMLFNTAIVREMINTIEENSANHYKWYEQCIAASGKDALHIFSEFETYGNYCINYHPQVLLPRHLNTFRHGSRIYGIIASKKEIDSLKFDLDTVSFEIRDYPTSWHRAIMQWGLYMGCRLINKLGI